MSFSLLPQSLSSDEEDAPLKLQINSKIKGVGGDKGNFQQKDDDSLSSDEDCMNEDFEFGGLLGEDADSNEIFMRADLNNSWSYKSALQLLEKNDSLNSRKPRINVASIISAARKNLRGAVSTKEKDSNHKSSEESDTNSKSDHQESDDESDDELSLDGAKQFQRLEQDLIKDRQGQQEEKGFLHNENICSDSETEAAKIEAAKAAKYFDSEHGYEEQQIDAFSQIIFARPLLRGVASVGYVNPTKIQAKVIPVALSGRDICASAITGSGKTAAFLLPVMERIIQRGGGGLSLKKWSTKGSTTTRGLVLTPTRELAAQCFSMFTAIAKFTNLRAALIVGGAKNVAAQATELRTRPDIVVGSPGRILDHLTNSPGVDLDDLEFLILDEADRLLDLGFQDEVHEIVKMCPAERQTLLFSATMGTKVDDLVKISLKSPIRIRITDKRRNSVEDDGVEVANRLEQEFVRVRAGNEGINREAMLLSLLTRTYTKRVIVFFDTKSDAHRLMILCGLIGMKAAELHGNLTQPQRIEALESFRSGNVDILLATDLAARGLDISQVKSVINFEMPSQVESYVHRIGRTARAGRSGKCCTLIGEGRRYLMKEIVKDAEQKRNLVSKDSTLSSTSSSTGLIRSRTIAQTVITHFAAKIRSLETHVNEVIAAEAVARMDRIAEMEAMRAQNIIEHCDEIKAREKKEWFSTAKEKLSVKEAAALRKKEIEERVGKGVHRMSRKKRRLIEAKRDLAEFQEEERKKCEESGKRNNNFFSENSIKINAKAEKNRLSSKAKDKDNMSIYDEHLAQEKIKKRKATVTESSLGDNGLFEEEKISFAEKKEASVAPSSYYEFHGYDSRKAGKKIRKKGVNAFKSKSKYKRR